MYVVDRKSRSKPKLKLKSQMDMNRLTRIDVDDLCDYVPDYCTLYARSWIEKPNWLEVCKSVQRTWQRGESKLEQSHLSPTMQICKSISSCVCEPLDTSSCDMTSLLQERLANSAAAGQPESSSLWPLWEPARASESLREPARVNGHDWWMEQRWAKLDEMRSERIAPILSLVSHNKAKVYLGEV